jgi:hypothetical protein
MKKVAIILVLIGLAAAAAFVVYKGNPSVTSHTSTQLKSEAAHHLNIPENGIQSMMEANSQKIIEGTDGSVILLIGAVTRKKVDITIKRDDRILDERLIGENDAMHFDYEGNAYTVELKNIKKPLLGIGKAEIHIK